MSNAECALALWVAFGFPVSGFVRHSDFVISHRRLCWSAVTSVRFPGVLVVNPEAGGNQEENFVIFVVFVFLSRNPGRSWSARGGRSNFLMSDYSIR